MVTESLDSAMAVGLCVSLKARTQQRPSLSLSRAVTLPLSLSDKCKPLAAGGLYTKRFILSLHRENNLRLTTTDAPFVPTVNPRSNPATYATTDSPTP